MLVPSSFISSSSCKLLSSTAPTFTNVVLSHAAGASSTSMSMSLFNSHHIKTVASSVVLPVALSVVGGAGGTTTTLSSLDLGRIKMRLEGLQAYGTICALLMNACLRLFPSDNDVPKESDSKARNIAFDVMMVAIIVSVLFGSFTTVVFTLLSLYSKRALGRGLDDGFIAFYEAATPLRNSGYRAFVYSLIAFELSFVLALFLKFKGKRRARMVGIASIISVLSMYRWTSIMRLAGLHIFTQLPF